MTDPREWTPRAGERREHPHGIERYIGFVLQGLVLTLILWIGTSVLGLRETAIRLEERSAATTLSSSRVETDLSGLRNQLHTVNTTIQAASFKIEDLERRVKGLELFKDSRRAP